MLIIHIICLLLGSWNCETNKFSILLQECFHVGKQKHPVSVVFSTVLP